MCKAKNASHIRTASTAAEDYPKAKTTNRRLHKIFDTAASSVYSGVFCLLALRGARDWRRGEAIQLQSLQDHHIFPQDYLKKRGFSKRVDINSILNRTLISDETNGKITNKAPAEYIASAEIFPSGASDSLLAPHFITQKMVGVMSNATKTIADSDLEKVYADFLKDREDVILSEVRKACGLLPFPHA